VISVDRKGTSAFLKGKDDNSCNFDYKISLKDYYLPLLGRIYSFMDSSGRSFRIIGMNYCALVLILWL
jgi:hypothetical protein